MKCSYNAVTGKFCVRSKGIRRKSARQIWRDHACGALRDSLSVITNKAKKKKIRSEARKLKCSWATRR